MIRYSKYLFLVLALGMVLKNLLLSPQPLNYANLYPNLPAPIARERALVTTIGQGAEGLIVAKLCDQLNLDYEFRYQATPADLDDVQSLILVLGFSPAGMASIHTTPGVEVERARRLVDAAAARHMPVVLLHLGGRDRRGGLNDLVLKEVVPRVSYVLVVEGGDNDGLLRSLTAANNIPMTEVKGIDELKVPLNSVFR